MPGPVVIVDYDPQWLLLYEEEKKNILAVIRHKVLAIEHVGSTAVPGLGAKPIINISARYALAIHRMRKNASLCLCE